MGDKSRKKKERRGQKQAEMSLGEIAQSEPPGDWKRITYGALFLLIGLAITLVGLMGAQDAHWPVTRYEPTYDGINWSGPVPAYYDYTPYLIDDSTEGMRWERKMYPWENPGYYLSAMLVFVGVKKMLPRKNKGDIA